MKSQNMEPFSNKIVDLYFVPFKSEMKVYKSIGIPFLGKYIPTGGSHYSIIGSMVKGSLPRKQRIITYYNMTLLMETIHIVGFLTTLLITFNSTNNIVSFLFSNVFNLLANVYPVFLQRYNRLRLLPIVERLRRCE
ncbi:hypothetical protein V4V53_004112 [Vibrio mimicus]